MIDINPKFLQVLDFVNQTNQCIFLTGKAGTGKTTLLKYIREKSIKQIAVVAPTGVAAINAGGSTIHSFFQFSFAPFLSVLSNQGEVVVSPEKMASLKYNRQRLAIFRSLELLIIDEVSMVRADLLDQIDQTLRYTRRRHYQPFGGVQVMLIGDMFQLPPVVPNEEWQLLSTIYKSPFFFDSLVMRQNPPVYIELQKIYRQSDQKFIELLNKVRNNEMDLQSLELINSHFKENITIQDYRENITLTTHNRKADQINTRNLNDLPTKIFHYKAKIEGLFSEKNFPNEADLILKVGARVMFLKNNAEKNYFNGKIGIVTFLDEDKIKVKAEDDFQEIEVPRETWTNVSFKVNSQSGHLDEEVLGTYSQFPLRHAWAITIHKSQGLTFDKLIIDAAEAFSAGQVYVALSRCRSLQGLILSSRIEPRSLDNDKNILQFASTKQNDQKVTAIYNDSRRKYLNDLLLSTFDFSEISELKAELAGNFQLHKKRLNAEAMDWWSGISGRLELLMEVSKKFGKQLLHLFESSPDFEADAALQQRIRDAAIYFSEEERKCFQFFDPLPLNTESKETADDMEPLLVNLRELLYQKRYTMQSLENGFDFQSFIKRKLNYRPVNVTLRIYDAAKSAKASASLDHPILYKRLVEQRNLLVEEFQRPIYMVAANKSLTEMATLLPDTEERLLLISGFGPAKVEAFGEAFLSVIRTYLLENNLHVNWNESLLPKKKKSKKKADTKRDKSPRESTAQKSSKLFREGHSIREIAKLRNLSMSTVETHLIPFITSGDINIRELISPAKQKIIEQALQKHSYEDGLTILKSKLPEDISFAEIRFVMAHRLRD